MMNARRSARHALHHARRRVACSSVSLRRLSTTTADEGKLLQAVSLERLVHQSRVHLQIPDATRATIRVVPTLQQSEFALRVFSSNEAAVMGDVFTVQEEAVESGDAQVMTVRLTKSGSGGGADEIDVLLNLPHLVDLDITAARGGVTLSDKIEGNVRVSLGDGDIRVNKVRGEQIQLKTHRGSIDVSALVEGENVKLVASAVNVKRLMSASTEIKLGKGSEDSDLGAIYSSLCLVNTQSSGALTVGNIHGFLRVNGEVMRAVNVHSVNGALHIEDSGSGCMVDAHFDAWSSDAANRVFVGGNVRVSLDPSSPIDLELHGNKITTGECKFIESELDQLDDDYAIFTGSLEATAAVASNGGASGKINVGSAKNAALRTSFFATEKNTSDQGAASASSDGHPANLPRLVVHASNGSVAVEQLDWMGKIKRKHLAQ